jgi:hypothetical protein
MAQGKIERCHCSIKREEFVGYHNNRRCHESLTR